MEHAAKMDRMYRRQRRIYDLSRKYFLIGRDALLDRIEASEGARIVEIGCGTARNLISLAKRHQNAKLFGVDVSREMLDFAQRKINRCGLGGRIALGNCSAERFDARSAFGVDLRFDAAVFSYSLSMIPDWRGAINAAVRSLTEGGTLYAVDFWDQRDLPSWFSGALRAWIRRFDVTPRLDLIDHLGEIAAAHGGRLDVESIGGRYAFLVRLASRSTQTNMR
jgi:S-adenosylmethionine-diacylgycerolhomoserine-N-methlytransferase